MTVIKNQRRKKYEQVNKTFNTSVAYAPSLAQTMTAIIVVIGTKTSNYTEG